MQSPKRLLDSHFSHRMEKMKKLKPHLLEEYRRKACPNSIIN
jgi:hypothetical protein